MVRAIAIYLPQFHPIPENDRWWGMGFTEWTNVTRGRPRFGGHYQPHLPSDLGFYDLRLPETRGLQAELAREYGIYGFCYYHYWFNGRRILERPFDEVLKSGKPNFPFCLCWANESWSRSWDGRRTKDVLISQEYSLADDRAHIRSLVPVFEDPRYIRVGNKPLFLVYRAAELPNPLDTTTVWREEAARSGVGELFLARVESWFGGQRGDPRSFGFDASVEFSPDLTTARPQIPYCLLPHDKKHTDTDLLRARSQIEEQLDAQRRAIEEGSLSTSDSSASKERGEDSWNEANWALAKSLTKLDADFIMDYRDVVAYEIAKAVPSYPLFRTASPGWDNTSRRPDNRATILINSAPEPYEKWLRACAAFATEYSPEPFVFLNAWNEWAEGNHLEPDQRFGRSFLEATRRALWTAV